MGAPHGRGSFLHVRSLSGQHSHWGGCDSHPWAVQDWTQSQLQPQPRSCNSIRKLARLALPILLSVLLWSGFFPWHVVAWNTYQNKQRCQGCQPPPPKTL